jgi:hypothetical protein
MNHPGRSRLQMLDAVLRDLEELEPIFHRAAFGKTVTEFARRMTSGYWEVGASGRRYDRAFILQHLEAYPPEDAKAVGWTCSGFSIQQLGPATYLLTYTLDQKGRITRRTTVWRRECGEWQIVFHQGTVVKDTHGSSLSDR